MRKPQFLGAFNVYRENMKPEFLHVTASSWPTVIPQPSSPYIMAHAHTVILLPYTHTHTTGAQESPCSPFLLQCTFTLTHTHTHSPPRRSTGLGQHNCLPFRPPCKSPIQNVAKQNSTGECTFEITACVGTSISRLMPQILSATNTQPHCTLPLTHKS